MTTVIARLNPQIKALTFKCFECNHIVIYVAGMVHHLYKNQCQCMCNQVIGNRPEDYKR